MQKPRPLKFAAAVFVVFAGCAGNRGYESTEIGSPEVTVLIDNRNFNDATIYATDGERRIRVGRVTGKTSGQFTFNWYQPEMYMLVDFTGVDRRDLFSQVQVVIPGDLDDFLLVIGIGTNGPVMLTPR